MNKKVIIIQKDFYNLYELEELKEYINGTCKKLAEIYNKLGGLESNLIDEGILTEEEMCDIFTFSDILENCKVVEIKE